MIEINSKAYFVHRLVWLIAYGEFPSAFLDHINRDRQDNRISNLRAATLAENNQNITRKKLKNFDMPPGVSPQKNRWRAEIGLNNKSIYLGIFKSVELASQAYRNAKLKMHSHQTLVQEAP
jgi:hypothetical protein